MRGCGLRDGGGIDHESQGVGKWLESSGLAGGCIIIIYF